MKRITVDGGERLSTGIGCIFSDLFFFFIYIYISFYKCIHGNSVLVLDCVCGGFSQICDDDRPGRFGRGFAHSPCHSRPATAQTCFRHPQ